MDPQSLIDPASAPMPAPFWLLVTLKVAGFAFHAVPMNLWYAGIVLSMILSFSAGQGRRFASRLMTQMPILIALGINFGIVPLLFIQVGYAKFFYPATILMAWPWLFVIFMLVPAYYGVYVYSFALARGEQAMRSWERGAGWLSALFFLTIGFLFANAMTLLTNVEGWPEIFRQSNLHGAATGVALNVADARLWPRWLMFFGLALSTVAAWSFVDAGWFARREEPQYRQWVRSFAWKLYTAGLVLFAVFGAWYAFGAWSQQAREVMFRWPWGVLTLLTALSPGLPWLLLVWAWWREMEITRGLAALVGVAHFGVILINAVSRQVVQNLDLRRFFDLAAQPTDVQWSSVLLFLGTLVVVLGVLAWMIRQIAAAPPAPEM